jgi:molybdopterin/thiamine biosynthesis adenylyltransferase
MLTRVNFIVEEMNRVIYDRQIRTSIMNNDTQNRIKGLRVLIPGCGALGSAIASLLVRMGVKFLRIVDYDFVEPSNYPRTSSIGLLESLSNTPKVVACETMVRRLNPYVEVESVYGWVSPINMKELVDGMDIVMDGLDNLKARSFIARGAWAAGIPYVYTGVSDRYYNVTVFKPGDTPCFDCVFNVPEEEKGGIPVLAPTVSVAASTAVITLVKLLRGDWKPSLLIGDVYSGSLESLPLSKDGCQCKQADITGKYFVDNIRGRTVVYTRYNRLFSSIENISIDGCNLAYRDTWRILISCGHNIVTVYRDGTLACSTGKCDTLIHEIIGAIE